MKKTLALLLPIIVLVSILGWYATRPAPELASTGSRPDSTAVPATQVQSETEVVKADQGQNAKPTVDSESPETMQRKSSFGKPIAKWLGSPQRSDIEALLNLTNEGLTSQEDFEKHFAIIDRLVAGGDSAVSALKSALESVESLDEKIALSEVLGSIGTKSAIEALFDVATAEEDPEFASSIVESLGALGDDANLATIAGMVAKTRSIEVLGGVSDTVGRMANSNTIELLEDLYHAEETVEGQQENVLMVLSSIGNPGAVEGLSTLVKSTENGDLLTSAATSLSKIGDGTGVAGLLDALNSQQGNEENTDAILELISLLENPEGRDALVEAQKKVEQDSPLDISITAALENIKNIEDARESIDSASLNDVE